ncbi:hypothetical protein [Streptomyces sp. MP131-18]|uniref:hypothetical protein n=1 Tax=Streptomyces sp. MP131-18 TaxID=1857892 RepID=UPI00097CA9BE|nr:hypothetical protein [Streptomyces sp. MP131-18]ONK12164.1 hypothetical protein STBA_29030 [Streptomyces sp. MP131-18]
MSGEPERIDPSGIPVFTGHLDTLAEKYTALRSDAEGIRGIGQAVDEQFQGLSGPYQAPEAADLLATTTPVRQRACAFADKLEMVALVLEIFAEEARPLIDRLDRLRGEAEAFVDEIGDGDDWRHDGDKTARNNELLREVSVTVAQFWEVERRAANNITLLVDGTTWVTDDGNGDAGTYGLSVADIEQVGETPWGRAVEEKHHAWELWHHAKSFVWDGIVVDGILGTLTGISTLVNPWSDGFGAAWQGLGKLATGVLVSSPSGLPLLAANQLLPDNPVSDWINDSVKARIEMTTGLVAWDTWSEDPARAAGATTFNLLTLVGTAGAGTAANTAGAAARAARIAGTAGRYLDPTTPLINGISAAVGSLPRLSGLTSGLANATTIPATPLPDGAYRLPDGSRLPADFTAADLPPGISALDVSDGTVAIPRSDTPGLGAGGVIDPATGNIVYPDGTLTRPDGTVLQHADEAPGELPARTDSPELAAVGAHNGPGGVAAHLDQPTPGGAGGGGHIPGQRGGDSGTGGGGGGRDGNDGFAEPDATTVRQQVERANTDPSWFDEYYRSDGHRRSTAAADENGHMLPILSRDPNNPGQWIARSDVPPPVPPSFIGDGVTGNRIVADPEIVAQLDEAASRRQNAITADQAAEHRLADAEAAYAADPSPENRALLREAEAAHTPAHREMTGRSEDFGESAAALHAIPENYPGATRVEVSGAPANGTAQFDQIYRRADGGYVVVEAKSSTDTRLGARTLPGGQRAAQGTRAYFEDILDRMDRRGGSEAALANDLDLALAQGRVEYVLVQGKPNGSLYGGYEMRQFDIG